MAADVNDRRWVESGQGPTCAANGGYCGFCSQEPTDRNRPRSCQRGVVRRPFSPFRSQNVFFVRGPKLRTFVGIRVGIEKNAGARNGAILPFFRGQFDGHPLRQIFPALIE
jgi:hypothetical protein